MLARSPSRTLLRLVVLTAVPLDAFAGPRTTWPSTIALIVLMAVLLGIRMAWRRFTGKEGEEREGRERSHKPSPAGAFAVIAVGAGGTVVALLAHIIGPAGGMLAVLGEVLPYALGVLCLGLYLAVRAR